MATPQKRKNRDCKVLSIVWYKVSPPKFGGQKAVALFNRYLSECLSLSCICSINNEANAEAYPIERILPISKAQFLNPFVWRNIYKKAKKENFSHLLLEFPYHAIAGMICKRFLKTKLVINAHNIEFIRFKEQKRWWWKLLFHYEKYALKKADAVFFKTKSDRNSAVKYFALAPKNVAVVPYGAEKSTMGSEEITSVIRKRHNIKEQEKILLFAGTLDYRPNAEAVELMSEKLVPSLMQINFAFKLVICGRNQLPAYQYLKKYASDKIVFAGDVDDIEHYFAASNVFINPVLSGGGIQTKIIDALSHSLNVVCFRSKATDICCAESKLFSVPDGDFDAFSEAVVKAASFQIPTPHAFFEAYNWHSIAEKASQKICSL